MNKKTLGALQRIIEEVKEKRKATCAMKDCIVNDMIGGDDIDILVRFVEIEKKIELD